MIEARNLEKTFKSLKALDKMSFLAKDGEVTGLLGPNGAGKTTSLRILYTIIRPDAGTASVDGFDVVKDRLDVQRRIGVLADNRGLYPRLTTREHIRYFARLHGMSGQPMEDRINELIASLGMDDIADRRVKGFSKGQAMKVSLARAMVHDPKNVLLDEPTNGLDVASARSVRMLIRSLAGEGRCVLFSSHIMQEIKAICDRLIIVAKGRVVAAGTQEEVCELAGKSDLEEAFLDLVGHDYAHEFRTSDFEHVA